MQREETRRQLIGRIRDQKREIAQLLKDAESWNDNNRWGESVDVGLDELYAFNAELDGMLRELTRDT